MRLNRFLSEETKPIGEQIKENCAFYLDFKKKHKCVFYKGVDSATTSTFKKLKTREDREFKGSSGFKGFEETVEKLMKKLNALSRKSSIPLTTHKRFANLFGDITCEVFPVGKFDYSFCKAVDFNDCGESAPFQIAYVWWLYAKEKIINKKVPPEDWNDVLVVPLIQEELEERGLNINDDISKWPQDIKITFRKFLMYGSRNEFKLKELEDGVKKLPQLIKTNAGMQEAVKNNYEIWINPKEFYLIPVGEVDSIF